MGGICVQKSESVAAENVSETADVGGSDGNLAEMGGNSAEIDGEKQGK